MISQPAAEASEEALATGEVEGASKAAIGSVGEAIDLVMTLSQILAAETVGSVGAGAVLVVGTEVDSGEEAVAVTSGE